MTITVYTKPNCVQCTQTKKRLTKKQHEYEEKDVTTPENMAYVKNLGYMQAPVVVITKNGVIVDSWAGFRDDNINNIQNI